MTDDHEQDAPSGWFLEGDDGPHNLEALNLLLAEGAVRGDDVLYPNDGRDPTTVAEVLGIRPALPVDQRLDDLARGLELPEGETIDTMKSDELPRVVSMIPRVDTLPVSKARGPVMTPQRWGAVVALLLASFIVAMLISPRSDDRRSAQDPSMADRGVADKVSQEQEKVEVKRSAPAIIRPGQKRLTLEEKQKILKEELEDLESCLPDPRPKPVTVQLKIKPNGAPFAIRLGTDSESLKDCVRAKVFRWRFPRFTGPSDKLSFSLGD